MPYNPGVADRRGDYIIAGADALGRGIESAAGSISQALQFYGQQRRQEDKMTGMLEQMGALKDPEFAQAYLNAPPGKKEGMFGKAMMDYTAKMEMVEMGAKMAKQKEMIEWSANFRRNFEALPPDEQQAVPAMAQDYVAGASEGMQPGQNFMEKVFKMSTRGQSAFMDLVSKGMNLMSGYQGPKAPQFMKAPPGQDIMWNPNTGAAQTLPREQQQGEPSYGEMPAPAPGRVGILRDGRGGTRVITPQVPGGAQGPTAIYQNAMGGGDPLPETSGAEVKNMMDSLFGE